MAQLTNTFIQFGDMSGAVTLTAATGSDFFIPDNADSRVALIIRNANTQNAAVTIKAGDGSLCALGDVKIPVAGGQTVFVPLDRLSSARVKFTAGANKGKVLADTAVDSGGAVSSVSFGIVSVQ